MQRNLDKKTSPTDSRPWVLVLVRQLLPLPNCQRATDPRGREFFILDALATAARGEERMTMGERPKIAFGGCATTKQKTPLNFLCRSNSGAGTEKRPTELVEIVTDG